MYLCHTYSYIIYSSYVNICLAIFDVYVSVMTKIDSTRPPDFDKQIIRGREILEQKRNRIRQYQKKVEFADMAFVAIIVLIIIITLIF